MANYLFAYTGGGMAQTDAEREAAMAAWGGWFQQLGAAVVDGGNPVGASTAVTASGNGQAAAGLTGYSIVSASDIDAAAELAKGCPILANGGAVEIYETIPVM
jgi:hypothetical protein